jgi:tRNA dimethylallyltransferase
LKKNCKYLIVLAGPTGVGKTNVAISLAQHFNTHIISADSRQFYKELIIGAATPEKKLLEAVPHHFVSFKHVTEYYNVSMFEQEVLLLLPTLFETHNCVIITGGSGLYIDAVCKGIDDMPDFDCELREQLNNKLQTEGIESLRTELKILDPESYDKIDLKNKNRIFRALEMCLLTGKPYSQFLTKKNKERPFEIIQISLNMDRTLLHEKINQRVDDMILKGLENEVRNLLNYRYYNALKTVGYKELFDYFDGLNNKETAIELIKRNTRRYARRQISWFNRRNDYTWFNPSEIENIVAFIHKHTAK